MTPIIQMISVIENRLTSSFVTSMDIKDLALKFGNGRFDIITVNAPDSSEYCVEQAMPVLSHDGMLVLRTVKLFFSDQDREKLIASLGYKYNVQVLSRNIYNLPTGFFYKLHKPLIITHKQAPEFVKLKKSEHVSDQIVKSYEKPNELFDFQERRVKYSNNSQVGFRFEKLIELDNICLPNVIFQAI